MATENYKQNLVVRPVGLKRHSDRIATCSFVATLLVVCLHTMTNGSELWNYALTPICKCAVPYFFIVSGYFLGCRCQEVGWWKVALHKRLKSLMVPYLVWGILFYICFLPIGIGADFVNHRPFGASTGLTLDRILSVFGLDLGQLPFCAPLWYLRALLICVILSPVLLVCVRMFKWLFVGGVFIAQIAFAPDAYPATRMDAFLRYGFSMIGFCYFSVGLLISQGVIVITKKMRISAIVLSAFVVALSYYTDIVCREFVPSLLVPFVLILIWSVSSCVQLPRIITSKAFQAYLIHSVCVLVASPIRNSIPSWLFFFVVLGVLFVAVRLIDMHRCRVFDYAFGGRV